MRVNKDDNIRGAFGYMRFVENKKREPLSNNIVNGEGVDEKFIKPEIIVANKNFNILTSKTGNYNKDVKYSPIMKFGHKIGTEIAYINRRANNILMHEYGGKIVSFSETTQSGEVVKIKNFGQQNL